MPRPHPLARVPGEDAYALTSYIYCAAGKELQPPKFVDLKYYYGHAMISGMVLAVAKSDPESRAEVLAAIQEDVAEARNELEALIKKGLGNRNIWVLDERNDKSYEMKLLKRI